MDCDHKMKLMMARTNSAVGLQEVWECVRCGLLKLLMPSAD